MKKNIFYGWSIIATAGFLYFGLHYLKTDFQTLYVGLDKSARKVVVSFLVNKSSPYQVTKLGDEVKVPAENVQAFRDELNQKISCFMK